MAANAVIDGTFSDLKTVKTRSVVQLVIEVPIERAAQVVEMFGFPQPGSEITVAVARLVAPPVVEPEKPRRPFRSLPRSQQAALKCNDPDFQNWIGARGRPDMVGQDTARHLRERLGVQSRSELDETDAAGKRWDALLTEYEISTGRMPEPR